MQQGPFDLDRPRLTSLLDTALEHRLTLLTAGPGTGRSTLLRAWRHGVAAAVWEPPTEGGWPAAAAGLVAAIAADVPDLPDLSAAWASVTPDAEEPARRADALAAAVARSLDGRRLSLIVDDMDVAGTDPGVQALMASLVRHGPATLHVVAAWAQPPEELATMAGLEITAEDLAFTLPELRALLQAVGQDVGRAQGILEGTGGWALGVRLALNDRPLPSHGSHVHTLRETLKRRSGPAQDLLAAAVGLPRITESLARRLGVPDADRALEELVGHGAFLSPTTQAGGWRLAVDVEPVVAAVIGETREARNDRLVAAADWFAEQGAAADALACVITTGDSAAIAERLVASGAELVSGGQAAVIIQAAAAVEPSHRTPLVDLLDGQARQVQGDWAGALQRYLRAAESGDPTLRPQLGWRVGLIHHLRGELDAAVQAYQEGMAGADPSDPMSEKVLADVALAGAWCAAACWLRGENDRSSDLATRALEDAEAAGSPAAEAAARTALALVAAARGDRAGNDAHYRAALAAARRAGDALQTIRIHTNRGSHFCEEGDFAAASEELQSAIDLSELTGERTLRVLALTNRAEVHHRLGRLEDATADIRDAQRICEELQTDLISYPFLRAGLLASDRGDRPQAQLALDRATAIARRTRDRQVLSPALAGAAVLQALQRPEAAGRLADQALSVAGTIARSTALRASAEVALAAGDRTHAAGLARQAIDDARQQRDRVGQAEGWQLLALADPADEEAIARARGLWAALSCPVGVAAVDVIATSPGTVESDRAMAVLEQLGANGVADRLRALRSDADDRMRLRLRTLGGMGLYRGANPLPQTVWQSRKSRLLLAYLVTREARPTAREAIADALWPDGDPARLGSRLSVELSKLRSALGDARDAVVADRDAVMLDPEILPVDVLDFLAEATASLAMGADEPEGSVRLEAADRAYTGDFVEEHPYEPWATALRDRARTVAAEVARALADVALAQQEPGRASRYLRRVLERDPWAEDAHLLLVQALEMSGARGDARRAYRHYVTRMEELGAPVEPFPAHTVVHTATPDHVTRSATDP